MCAQFRGNNFGIEPVGTKLCEHLFVGKGHPVLDQCVCERQQLLPRRRVACHWTQPFGKATLMRRRILRRIVAKDASSQSPSARISPASIRSEEHTSELQSLMRISYAVFC